MKKKVVGGQYYTFYANEIKMHASEHFKRHPPYSTAASRHSAGCTSVPPPLPTFVTDRHPFPKPSRDDKEYRRAWRWDSPLVVLPVQCGMPGERRLGPSGRTSRSQSVGIRWIEKERNGTSLGSKLADWVQGAGNFPNAWLRHTPEMRKTERPAEEER